MFTAIIKFSLQKINNELAPIRENIEKLSNDKDYVYDVLKEGAKKASEVAEKTLYEVRNLMGLVDDKRK